MVNTVMYCHCARVSVPFVVNVMFSKPAQVIIWSVSCRFSIPSFLLLGYCEECSAQGKFPDMISVFRASKMHLLCCIPGWIQKTNNEE